MNTGFAAKIRQMFGTSYLTRSRVSNVLRLVYNGRGYSSDTRSDTAAKPLSYACGDAQKDQKRLTYTTVGHEVDAMADRFGDREAVVDCQQGIRKTFIEYKRDIDRLAAGLASLDLRRGDRVAIWCPNRYEWVLSQFATAKLGFILVTLNPAYRTAEVEDCLQRVQARGLIMADRFKTQNYYEMIAQIAPDIVHSRPGNLQTANLPHLQTIIVITDESFPGTFKFHDVFDAGGKSQEVRVAETQKEISPDDAVMIQFTSGTTGKPKAVPMTHHNIVNSCRIHADLLGHNAENHRQCIITPLFHVIASVGGSMNMVINGQCSVFPAPSFNAALTLKAIQHERCTSICGTPTMFVDILKHPDFEKTDLTSLRNGVMGGATSPPDLVKAVASRMHCPGLTLGYGATEMSGAIALHHQHKTMDEKLASDGTLFTFLEAKIVDDENRLVPMGEPGEICVRGYKVMKGYWNDDQKTAEVIKDGWYHTGDVGILREDKTLKVIDRKKDMIIRGGENISPREIEEYLLRHPKIDEVHVIGVPDDRMGEEVCAWIKVKKGELMSEDDVLKNCQGNISHYKIPRYVKFVQEFPRTAATGKVQKSLMRQAMQREMQTPMP